MLLNFSLYMGFRSLEQSFNFLLDAPRNYISSYVAKSKPQRNLSWVKPLVKNRIETVNWFLYQVWFVYNLLIVQEQNVTISLISGRKATTCILPYWQKLEPGLGKSTHISSYSFFHILQCHVLFTVI